MTVRIRGIYTTALTALLDDVVQASPPIQERFDDSFPVESAAVTVDPTARRQGVILSGEESTVDEVHSTIKSIGTDTLSWEASLPRGAVYAGEVVETLGSGALVDCGDGTGFLPYSKTARRIETGDTLRVQVTEPKPPWVDSRPVLDVTVRIPGELLTLVRGGDAGSGSTPELADILPESPPDGWAANWGRDADDASLDALSDALSRQTDRAAALDDAFTDAEPPAEVAPARYWGDERTYFVWFGRESRFELDELRRSVAPTMPGHHRIKAATDGASRAVDFLEQVTPEIVPDEADLPLDSETDSAADADPAEQFPFEPVTNQFGPREGDSIRLGHGKPAGHRIELGRGEVTAVGEDGTVTVERELSGGGTYDALGVDREDGDVATTKFKEGRWWYPTVYRSADGEKRGTYVNICTPVEVFPDQIRYVDLHVDVIKHADGTVERVDDDELDEAVADGQLSAELAEKARSVARAIESAL